MNANFTAAANDDRNEIAEQAAGDHAHTELNRWYMTSSSQYSRKYNARSLTHRAQEPQGVGSPHDAACRSRRRHP